MNKYKLTGESQCSNNIFKGYNITDPEFNYVEQCYSTCNTCGEGKGTEENNNCLTCKEGYFFNNEKSQCLNVENK